LVLICSFARTSSVLNGNLYFYDVEEGKVTCTIEGRRDIAGGRHSTDAMTAENSMRSKYFTSIAYTPDGSCIIAGGRSKYICIYAIRQQLLVKKFQISHNVSLEGVMDELRNTNLTEGGSLNALDVTDSEGEGLPQSHLPGAKRGADGSRITKPEVRSTCVRFSSTAREWAAATPEGLLVYSLDTATLFDPTDIDEAITPQSIRAVSARGDHAKAVNMALHLGEDKIIKEAVDHVEPHNIPLVVQGLAPQVMRTFLRFLADQVASSRHLEYYLQWCRHSLLVHSKAMMADSLPYMESIRTLIRAITNHEKDMMRMCDDNQYVLDYLGSVSAISNKAADEAVPAEEPAGDAAEAPQQHDNWEAEEAPTTKRKKSKQQEAKAATSEPEPEKSSKKKRKKGKVSADDS
jgi:periodic tryptophan protein 2